MSGGPPRPCEVDDAGLGDAPGVAIHGEVDIGTVDGLERVLERAILDSVGAFVIDISDVAFLDSSGIQALLRARGVLGREDRALALICPPGAPRRALEVSGCAELFVICGSREEAAAALVPAD
jgi:anti-anti-sigma factor